MGEKNALRRAVLLALGLLLTAAVLFGCGRDEVYSAAVRTDAAFGAGTESFA